MKKIIVAISICLLLVIGFLIYKNINNYKGDYLIYAEKIDDLSPDRILKVTKNGKETKKYKYIRYDKGNIKEILCYPESSAVNVFSLDVEELTIVLPNDEEVIAKIIKE